MEKATIISGQDSSKISKVCCGVWINRYKHRDNMAIGIGWEIDPINLLIIKRGGIDN